jgi:hypothetical protein
MRILHLAILRSSALLVPGEQRTEWFAEWKSELWYVRQGSHRERDATAFCLGAFKDAFWLRRNSPRLTVRNRLRLESPLQCGLFLAVLAAVSVFFAMRSPGPRDMILPSPYRDARNLVMISTDARGSAWRPSISIADYQSLAARTQRMFSGLAFYQPIRTQVHTTELTVALASSNLFELLNIPVPDPGERQPAAALILSRTAWRKYFASDPHLAGRVLEVAGRQALVAGVISADSWALPGRMDAWLLEDEQHLATLPPHSKGFVLGHVRASALHNQRNWRWRMSLPNEHGGYDNFECASLARGQLIVAYLLMIVLAIVILGATTSLGLGEYPPNRNSPRRWIFLALKIALIVPIIFCGSLNLASFTATEIQPHALLVGYVLAFRWALIDQRKRCPVCLRLLANPTRIGRPSQTFLEWYGTELMCLRGHGLLHVPEIPTISFNTQRWLYLDRSWSGLFP